MDDTTSRLFIFLTIFFVLVTIISAAFGIQMAKTNITDHDQPSNVNALNAGELLIGIMTFQFTDEVPPLLSIFLDMCVIFGIFVIAVFIRG